MKGIATLTALFSCFAIGVNAQQLQKIPASPAYDNVKEEHAIKHVQIPRVNDKFALMDNGSTGTSVSKQDETLFKVHATSTPSSPYDIKKVTFPKTNSYLKN